MQVGPTSQSDPDKRRDRRRTDLSRDLLNNVWEYIHNFACGSMWSGLNSGGVLATLKDFASKALHVGEIGEFKGQTVYDPAGKGVSSDHLVEAYGEKVDLDQSVIRYILRNKDKYSISGPNDPALAEEVTEAASVLKFLFNRASRISRYRGKPSDRLTKAHGILVSGTPRLNNAEVTAAAIYESAPTWRPRQ